MIGFYMCNNSIVSFKVEVIFVKQKQINISYFGKEITFNLKDYLSENYLNKVGLCFFFWEKNLQFI